MQYKVCKSGSLYAPSKKSPESGHHCAVVHIELVTSWPVTVLWILISWMVSTLATTAYVHPEWLVRELHPRTEALAYDQTGLVSTLGMVSVCGREQDGEGLECRNLGEDFPSAAWQAAYVMYGSGCVLFTWCSILAFCNVWVVHVRNRQLIAIMIGRIQLVAVVLQAASLLVYPAALGTPVARAHCGPDSSPFAWAGCRLGWAYAAAIAATVLAGYCPLLAHFSHHNRFKPYFWTDI